MHTIDWNAQRSTAFSPFVGFVLPCLRRNVNYAIVFQMTVFKQIYVKIMGLFII